MTTSPLDIGNAVKADLADILELQRTNQIANGGMLASELTAHQIEEMMSDMPQIVARRNGEVVAFLLTTSQAISEKRPLLIIQKMLDAYPKAEPDAYIYGPICVDARERGNGLAKLMFEKLLKEEPGRQGILFIRSDNEASMRAHLKMGMEKVGEFTLNDAAFHVFAYKSARQM